MCHCSKALQLFLNKAHYNGCLLNISLGCVVSRAHSENTDRIRSQTNDLQRDQLPPKGLGTSEGHDTQKIKIRKKMGVDLVSPLQFSGLWTSSVAIPWSLQQTWKPTNPYAGGRKCLQNSHAHRCESVTDSIVIDTCHYWSTDWRCSLVWKQIKVMNRPPIDWKKEPG